jgi:hypothetical protein
MSYFTEDKFILGIGIVKNREAWAIILSHEQCTKEIMEKYGMPDITLLEVPMARTHYRDGEVASDQHKVALTPPEHGSFRAILEFGSFLCMCTKPEITFTIIVIKRRQIAPMQLHTKQLKRLLSYLNEIRSKGTTYDRVSKDNAYHINVFLNLDMGADTTTRRSQSGEVAMLNGGVVKWTSKHRGSGSIHHKEGMRCG